MSYTLDNGTSTPNLAGMLTAASGLRINDGTFVLTRCDLFDSAPVRSAVAALTSTHGGYAGTSFYDIWPFVIEGYLTVPLLEDIWGAKDDLKASFNLDAGLQTLELNNSGWSTTRMINAIIAGPIQFIEPVMLEKNVPDRDFVIPMVAPDPRIYSTSSSTTTVTTATPVSNDGTAATPFVVRFTGPQTGPCTLTDPDGNHITVGTVASGHWVEVNTRDPATGTLTVVDDTGANAIELLTSSTATVVPPGGTSAWTATKAGGTGATTLTCRDAWA